MSPSGPHAQAPSAGLHELDGVRVVDFTQALSGPFATMMLADLGADVVKVEPPGRGDDSRHWGPPFVGETAAYFLSVNRNKRSVALDLKDDEDRDAALRLVSGADVVVENWRPGTAARLGLGPESLRRHHPRLVVCSVSGYGQDGDPRAGYDQIVQGTSGVMSLTGPTGQPMKWGVPGGDLAAGMFAATAIVAALYRRGTTGVGCHIDIAMQDSLVAMLSHQAARYLSTRTVPGSDVNGHASIAPYGSFEVADGHVNICVGNDAQFRRLSEALALPELADDARFVSNRARLEHRAELLQVLDQTLRLRSVVAVTGLLEAAGVPVGPVRDLAEVLEDPEVRRRSMLLRVGHPDDPTTEVVNGPIKIDRCAPAVRRQPPRLGEHTEEVLAEAPEGGPG
ncbi:MAG: CoA transferase [Nocardioidaceae bacterium]